MAKANLREKAAFTWECLMRRKRDLIFLGLAVVIVVISLVGHHWSVAIAWVVVISCSLNEAVAHGVAGVQTALIEHLEARIVRQMDIINELEGR